MTKPNLVLQKKNKKKHHLELKSLRIAAGYDSRHEFVEAVNKFLEARKIDYRIGIYTYTNYETGVTTSLSAETAYYLSQFLQCSIEIFIKDKICS